MILGITGGTGCGKTTLLRVLQAHGARVLDCDEIYHQLLATDPSLLAAIENRFPGTVQNGQLQRKKLGAMVFPDRQALLDLNHITHGAVRQAVLGHLETPSDLTAVDAIGLFEGNLAELCDLTIGVTAPVEDRVKRLMARDGIPEDYARARIAAQKDEGWFRERCDCVLENTGTEAQFREKCLAFLQERGIISP